MTNIDASWEMDFRNQDDVSIYKTYYHNNTPLPRSGDMVWVPGEYKGTGYKVSIIHFAFDLRIITIQVSA